MSITKHVKKKNPLTLYLQHICCTSITIILSFKMQSFICCLHFISECCWNDDGRNAESEVCRSINSIQGT